MDGVRALLNINSDIRRGEDGRPASHEEIPNRMAQDEHAMAITTVDGIDTRADSGEGIDRVHSGHSNRGHDEGSFEQSKGCVNNGSEDNDDNDGAMKENGRPCEESESSVEEDTDGPDPWGEGAGEAAWGRCKNRQPFVYKM